MGFGLAELIIIGAILVAVGLFFFMSSAAVLNTREKRKVSQPARIDWNAIADAELQSYLPNMKINAIRRYCELTGAGLKEAKETIEYVIIHPDEMMKGKAGGGMVDTDGAGIRDLIAAGRIDEAVDVYAAFMGVDEFSARDAVAAMQREDEATSNLSFEAADEVYNLLIMGKKIDAIKYVRETTGLGLKEAKDMVEQMENEGH